jgi:hypothetical protein
MPINIEAAAPTLLAEAALTPRGPVYPSPSTWRDQLLYFLLPDRFSDGREEETGGRASTGAGPSSSAPLDKRAWMEAGKVFQGGTLRGIQSKLGYLQRAGRHHALDRPHLAPAPRPADLPRLRHPELSGGRSSLRLPAGAARSGGGGPRARDVRFARHHLQPHRQQLVLQRGRGATGVAELPLPAALPLPRLAVENGPEHAGRRLRGRRGVAAGIPESRVVHARREIGRWDPNPGRSLCIPARSSGGGTSSTSRT